MRTATYVVVALLAVAAMANTQMFAERHRHGEVYRRAVEAENAHHQRLGFVPNTTKNWFAQLIDHQNPALGTFQDKFYYDTQYWNGTGPCMMYLNGEGPLGSSVGGYMADIAKALGACTLSIEHRWYGESLPAPLTNKALLTSTLTIDQAMQDVMALIEHFQANILNKPKGAFPWMLVGGSYSGGMTVWMNEKYPGFFQASWSASGVVRATFAYDEYDGHVASVTSGKCRDALARVMRIAEHKWDKGGNDLARIQALFNIPSYNTKTDFMWAMADISASSVQYSMNTEMCNGLLPLPEDEWDALAKYQKVLFKMWGSNFMASCYYSTKCLADSSLSAGWAAGGYSWIWECCNQVAWWQIGYPNSIRSKNITTSYFVDQCRAAFYQNTSANTWSFNEKYHGYTPVTKGNIIATQGSDDPWSTTGLKYSQGPTFPVNTAECTNCGHCSSMMAPKENDPENLVAQRKLVLDYMSMWISQW